MNKKLLDLSGKIDSNEIELFEIISNITKAAKIPYFIVGATARDMILTAGYDIQTTRATLDIDLGIQFSDWNQFTILKSALRATGEFELAKEPHRLTFRGSIPIDIIPFGSIAASDKSITWPPEDDFVMSTMGFEEAYRHSLTVRLKSNPNLDVQFASLSGIVLLKLISWNENAVRREKDAIDIVLIMRNYLEAGNTERLYTDGLDMFDDGDFDYESGGASLLGRDVASIANDETKKTIIDILTDEQKSFKLAANMREGHSGEEFEKKLQLLDALKLGVLDIIKQDK